MRSEIGKDNMGFNKRFVGKDNVLGVYDISGLQGLKDYFFKPDLLFFSDDFSANVYNLLYESKDIDAEIEVKKELNNKN
tara:strand:+ start:440 stop:676 length:237 start_codon:yes stop_codon:yes gene_type:complete